MFCQFCSHLSSQVHCNKFILSAELPEYQIRGEGQTETGPPALSLSSSTPSSYSQTSGYMLPAIAPQTAWCTKHIKIYSCQLHYDFRPHHTTSISSSSPTCHSPASDHTHVLSRSSSSTPSSNISTAYLKRLPAHQVVCISRYSFRQYHVFFKLYIGPSCHIVISIYIVSKKGIT